MTIIGLAGKAGSGKSTIAEILKKLLPGAEITPFAMPVKQAARELGWNGVKDENGRKILTMLGTDIGRNLIDQGIWIKRWKKLLSPNRITIVDDVRFDNEAREIRNLGGSVHQILCSSRELPVINDESENGISDSLIHGYFENDGLVSTLPDRVIVYFRQYLPAYIPSAQQTETDRKLAKLEALESCGVDNWEGYGEAMQEAEKLLEARV